MRKIKNKKDKLRKYSIKLNGISRQNGKSSLMVRKFKGEFDKNTKED